MKECSRLRCQPSPHGPNPSFEAIQSPHSSVMAGVRMSWRRLPAWVPQVAALCALLGLSHSCGTVLAALHPASGLCRPSINHPPSPPAQDRARLDSASLGFDDARGIRIGQVNAPHAPGFSEADKHFASDPYSRDPHNRHTLPFTRPCPLTAPPRHTLPFQPSP